MKVQKNHTTSVLIELEIDFHFETHETLFEYPVISTYIHVVYAGQFCLAEETAQRSGRVDHLSNRAMNGIKLDNASGCNSNKLGNVIEDAQTMKKPAMANVIQLCEYATFITQRHRLGSFEK